MKTIKDYELEDIGIDHCQYFAGASLEDFDAVYIGIGDTPNEAMDDACANAATDGWDVTPILRVERWPNLPSVIDVLRAQAKEEGADVEEYLARQDNDLNYYVALRVRE